MKPPKKRNTRKTAIRQRILSTAIELFYKNGIQAVGVDKIVAEAKVAKMTMYSYFPSKEDLILEFLETTKKNWFAAFHEFLNHKALNDLDRLTLSFSYLRKLFDENDNFRGSAFINAATELSDPIHPAHHIILDFQEELRSCFERWAYNSTLKNCRQLSYSLLLLFQGASTSALIENFPEPIKHAADCADQLLLLHRSST